MQWNDVDCKSENNSFDLAGTPCVLSEPTSLNNFKSIKSVLTATFEQDPLEANLCEQSTV